MTQLAIALLAFVGSHFLLSHPLRAPLVAKVGPKAFLGLYSLVAFATFGWIIFAFREAPFGTLVWSSSEAVWAVATAIMFVASVFLVGSLIGNPAFPHPEASPDDIPPARGVFAITRHPMMWAFALWSLVHVLVSPRPPVILTSAAIAILALGGSVAQDAKKKILMGDRWSDWTRRTAFVPFAGQLSGRIPWAGSWPGRAALVGGTLLWLAATWAHPWLGAPVAGIWYWAG